MPCFHPQRECRVCGASPASEDNLCEEHHARATPRIITELKELDSLILTKEVELKALTELKRNIVRSLYQ